MCLNDAQGFLLQGIQLQWIQTILPHMAKISAHIMGVHVIHYIELSCQNTALIHLREIKDTACKQI